MFENCTFENNTGTAIEAFDSKVIIQGNNTFQNNVGTAVYAKTSELFFQGISTFKNNSGNIGVGIQLRSSSYMHLQAGTFILFENNHAHYVGGGIYIDHDDQDGCFFDSESSQSEVLFINNTANLSGSSLYGKGIELCCIGSDCTNFFDIFNTSNTEADPSAIGSDPDDIMLL